MTDNQCLCITLRYEEEGAASGVSWASLSSGRPAAVPPLITQTLQEAEERSSKNKLTPNSSRRQKRQQAGELRSHRCFSLQLSSHLTGALTPALHSW